MPNGKHERWKAALWIQRIVALLLLIVGLTLTVGGALLAASGGSFYYVLTGLALIASGTLIWRGDARGVWLYGAMLIWTSLGASGKLASLAGNSYRGSSHRSS